MADFKQFKEGDTLRIQLNHLVDLNRYPESIYCIFKYCSYRGESDYIDELVVDQIIDVEHFLNKEEYRTVERKFKDFGRKVYSLHYRMHE